MSDKETLVQQAIRECESGAFSSIRAAARAYGVPVATLAHRMQGRRTRRESDADRQRLTPRQEEALVQWILEQSDLGSAPSFARVREMVTFYLAEVYADTQPLGKKWMQAFLRRNPAVKSAIGRRIDNLRAQGTTVEAMQPFFDRFDRVKREFSISPSNIWNMDETGLQIGVCANQQVIGPSSQKRVLVKGPNEREWASIIESISATGEYTRPVVIFTGNYAQSTWFPTSQLPDWLYTTQERGWTSSSIALDWLEKIFLPETATNLRPNEYRMLVLDGHATHASVEFLYKCKQNKVQLVFLPAHSSHILQPLDLSVFGALKREYRSQLSRIAHIDDSAPIKKAQFVECYKVARKTAFTSRTIRTGWAATGLHPWCPSKALQSSQVVIRQTTTPPPTTSASDEHVNTPFATPKRARDVERAMRSVQSAERLSLSTVKMLRKCGKAIDQLDATAVSARAETRAVKQQLAAGRVERRRKRVVPNPNDRFLNVGVIQQAIANEEPVEPPTVARNTIEPVVYSHEEYHSRFLASCSSFQA